MLQSPETLLFHNKGASGAGTGRALRGSALGRLRRYRSGRA
jgi:hypothetical protein